MGQGGKKIEKMTNLLIKCWPWYFYEGDFQRSMAPNKDMLDVSIKGHDDGNHIGVPNLIDMFSMATLVIRANFQM